MKQIRHTTVMVEPEIQKRYMRNSAEIYKKGQKLKYITAWKFKNGKN